MSRVEAEVEEVNERRPSNILMQSANSGGSYNIEFETEGEEFQIPLKEATLCLSWVWGQIPATSGEQ